MKKISTKTQSFTKKDTISLDKYFNDINKEELISAEQEVELSKRIREGDLIAEHKLITSNLRFVITVAKQYQGQGIGLDDLICYGNLGLIKAAKKFDETKGFKFISYAVWWIRQSIIQALSEYSRIVRLPLNKIDMKNKIAKAIVKLRTELDRDPSILEIAEELNEEIHLIEKTMKANNAQSYLDDPLKDGEDNTLGDLIENQNSDDVDKSLIKDSMQRELTEAFQVLTEKEQSILRMFFGIGYEFPMGCDSIGKEYGMGSERIRQIKDVAIRRLRVVSKKLGQYL